MKLPRAATSADMRPGTGRSSARRRHGENGKARVAAAAAALARAGVSYERLIEAEVLQ